MLIRGEGLTYINIKLETNTAEAVKTWLATNKPKVQYILENASYTKITDTTLIGQLNAIEKANSYEDTTIITTTYADGNSQMIINATALKKGSE